MNLKAKELLNNGKIAARINELRGSHQQGHEITIGVLSAQLDEDRQFARQSGNSAAAVSATMGKARLFGFLNNRPENTNERATSLRVEEVSRLEKRGLLLPLSHASIILGNINPVFQRPNNQRSRNQNGKIHL